MTDKIRNGQSPLPPQRTPAPAPVVTPAPQPQAKPRMQGDQAQLSAAAEQSVNEASAADRGAIAVGVQTFVQGATRGLAQTSKARGLLVFADLAEGNGGTIGKLVDKGMRGAQNLATRVLPRHADTVAQAAAPLLRGAGAVTRVLGKVAPGLNILVAGYDVSKAALETDPAKKNAAVANAGLSVGGTALAVGGVLLGATPVGWALGAGAAAVAAFQLVDTLAFDGKGTAWLGENVAKPITDGAKKVWGAITSL